MNGTRLSRPLQQMPPDTERLLRERGLRQAYDERPAYQRNDYLAWIARARRPETRQNRLNQMLAELEHGGLYMNMAHAPSQKPG
jgi:uncharacterized protein YdeI (YjbR/CyaY-like superfamily)